ncbi:transient receptor potential cation channel subfamily v member 3-like [Plakobranchus ocellatus]|uniref:Transient receptor potential cation channel subfamily v member 3-like n=1 Tax=Plakobranchus ocellatus TaxID=259542 RepID=A0AAV3YK03_9GAST|nr:transient receptor potential cation channel subfamily v member 3-like [Plakobranchus ocellatus]
MEKLLSASEFSSRLSKIDLNNNGHQEFLTVAKSFLEQYPVDFIRKLRACVRAGERKCFQSYCMIRILQFCKKGHLLMDKCEQSILHLTATFHGCHKLIDAILCACPSLALRKRTGEHSGLTALHILVSKEAVEATQHVLDLSCLGDFRPQLLKILADGNRFKKTNLMGQTVLSAAVLNFSKPLVVALMDAGADLMAQNSLGDTALHSLVRFANMFPTYREEAIEMMASLQEYILMPKEGEEKLWGKRYARKVWFCRNYENMTALQLAATLGEHQIVSFIMDLQWVYRTLYDYNGIFETNLYDITEIDTLAGEAWNQHRSNQQNSNCGHYVLNRLRKAFCCSGTTPEAYLCGPPVMEVICEVDIASACNIISTPVVTKLIKDKWNACKVLFYIWACIHLAEMIFLTVYAEYKFNYLDDVKYTSFMTLNNSNTSSSCRGTARMSTEHPGEQLFLDIASALAFAGSVIALYLEFIRSFIQKTPWNLHLIHHNGSFRLVLLLKAIAIFIDSCWFFACPKTNDKTPLVLALLLGWWFCTFFLRPFRIFSFFSVMLMKVLFGDMLRFFSIILIELVSFTLVIHLLFQNNINSPPEEFQDLGSSFMTMFKLMLGLVDLNLLHKANPAWLATALFVIYILLTYVLLINSLIAMMSITCSEIKGERDNQWKIQRLSVILFLEKLLPCGLARLTGRRLYYHKRQGRSHSSSNPGEMRYVITDTKSSSKSSLRFGVDRSVSQDLDEVDTDVEDDNRGRAVILSCLDDDTPSQPPSPTASLTDADFAQMGWFKNSLDFGLRERDSEHYIELDVIREMPESMNTSNEDHSLPLSRPTDLSVNSRASEPVTYQNFREIAEKRKPTRTDYENQQDETEYGAIGAIDATPDTRRPAIYSDPQWVALLKSIRSFESRPKSVMRMSSLEQSLNRSVNVSTRKRLKSVKMRNEFIFEGRKKSVDDLDD